MSQLLQISYGCSEVMHCIIKYLKLYKNYTFLDDKTTNI
jgi:hypothetical protein